MIIHWPLIQKQKEEKSHTKSGVASQPPSRSGPEMSKVASMHT